MSILSILYTILIGPLQLLFEAIFTVALRVLDNPGLAVIVLSILMNILVLPLYRRADAMQEAARDVDIKLSKGVKHIKKTFTGDERMMILQAYYRQNNYKPTDSLKGSVSLLLEVPFFIAAYQFLAHAGAFNGENFGPIRDLGQPDGLITIGGLNINLLPILMTAINVISSTIYLKGFPVKTKVQLYSMSAFFLVFLYSSPAGLVFYWTLNNLFSMGKTIILKLKNPMRGLELLLYAIEIIAIGWGVITDNSATGRKDLLTLGLGAVFITYLIMRLAKRKKAASEIQSKAIQSQKKTEAVTAENTSAKENKSFFLIGAILLTLLIGGLIPSALIADSPQEFLDLVSYYNPLWYVVYTLCMAAGSCLVWLQVFYGLAGPEAKRSYERLIWILCGVAIMDYMCFGTDLGIISANLQFEQGLAHGIKDIILNVLAVAAVAGVCAIIAKKYKRTLKSLMVIVIITISAMTIVNATKINTSLHKAKEQLMAGNATTPHFTLSKEGKNVVVIMLDRAMGCQVPYIFEEDPELKETFDGFTYYSNTISFGCATNYAAPALFGGYEYTPVEINRRTEESLVSKHNEALKVMPVMFYEEGYEVTVCDAPYANYQWIPDMSIYDDYSGINTYITEGSFGTESAKGLDKVSQQKKFFSYSLMKASPLIVQGLIYNQGSYNLLTREDAYSGQVIESTTKAKGISQEFIDGYNVLLNLPAITMIEDGDADTFMMMCNNMTHEPMLLQKPDYTVSEYVDNSGYGLEEASSITIDGRTLNLTTEEQIYHYHTNMAAMKQLGNWLKYLQENDVYDNTRIIIVSDHGRAIGQVDELILGDDTGHQAESYFPLLMVKDFDASGFTTSDEFMTNGDVPTIAVDGLIDNPTNPFTGNAINNNEKTAHKQYISISYVWKVEENNGNVFIPCEWYSVEDNIWDKENWTYIKGEVEIPAEIMEKLQDIHETNELKK